MLFEITHTTDYRYSPPAIEAYLETRLTPPELPTQRIIEHQIETLPELPVSDYRDSFGNVVNFFSLAVRHDRLAIKNRLRVETFEPDLPQAALEVSVAEARQVFSASLLDVFDYLQPSSAIPTGGPASEWARRYLASRRSLGEGLQELNTAIYQTFKYESGSTDNSTPIAVVWKQRRGVCQDFAHVMLQILRTAGLPCRYVCGYIESTPPTVDPSHPGSRNLVGSVATHAWVEVLVPGMRWVALDPTNNQWCAQQHVAVSFGRDSRDAAPVRGTFKGAGRQEMRVRVKMKRQGRGK